MPDTEPTSERGTSEAEASPYQQPTSERGTSEAEASPYQQPTSERGTSEAEASHTYRRGPASGEHDAFWRRPTDVGPPGASAPPPAGGPGAAYPGMGYQAPPPMSAPPSGWRPPRLFRPAEPRRLPAQDHARIDDEEARARTVTMGVGIVISAIFIVTLCALCARTIF